MRARTVLTLVPLLLSLLAFACDGESQPRGFTACGDFPSGPVECQPGQYCADATFSECVPGCTSDVNCADSQTCVKPAGQSVGDCRNSGPAPSADAGPGPMVDAGPVPSGRVEECRVACQNAGFFCEDGRISASAIGACEVWCEASSTTDSERTSLVGCVDAAFFTPAVCDEESCLP